MSTFSRGFSPVLIGPKRPLVLLVVVAALSFIAGFIFHAFVPLPSASLNADAALVRPVFSPGQSEPVLLDLIDSADARLDVMLYQFSYTPLQVALAMAAARGVTVRVLMDPKIDSNLFVAEKLVQSGVRVRWASRSFASTHAKFMVVDRKAVFVGSTNWSRHAMQLNREAAVSIENIDVANSFESVFETDWNIGTPWTP
ncbi:phospholipase D family protein [Candidatus Micrarchaeota archaeon]|nr:phospholipase D family protein [Candidatus Micrarchaeota archaeon]